MLSRKKQIIHIVSSIIIITATISVTAGGAESAIATKVSGGEIHTLVLTESKSVWASGDNDYYQLGINNDHDEWTLIRVHDGEMSTTSGYIEDIDDIDGGWLHSLALDISGYVWAWGDNEEGQLGDNSNDPHSTPVQVHGVDDVGYLGYIIAISAGRSGLHSIAVDTSNFVYAWGRNEEGQIGNDESGSDEKEVTPVKVHDGEMNTTRGYLENIIAVSAAARTSMALTDDGYVYTWGSNRWPDVGGYPAGKGKLGNGNTTVDLVETPVQVLKGEQPGSSNFLEDIVAISAGWDHCMALADDGYVYTWGNNGNGWGNEQNPYSDGGRLGDGSTTSSSTPVEVVGVGGTGSLTNIVAISAGEGHSMALDTSGNVYCWGDNYFG